MATSSFKLCSICEIRQKTNQATVWCPECEDSLCVDCEEHHGISKATRRHTTVLIDDYQNLPPFVLDAKMFCEEHNEKFHHYCISHERPLCKTCIVTAHSACKDLKIIEDVIGNCKTSYAVEAVVKDLKEILCHIQQLKQDRESNFAAIKRQRSSIVKRVSELRDKINQHLDSIEKAFIADLSSVADDCQKRISDFLENLISKERRIDELLSSIGGMKEHASDFQTFIAMKEIEKRVNEEKTYIRSILESACCNQIELSCSFESSLENLTTSARKFGTLSVKENSSKINLHIKSIKQAQIECPTDDQDNKLLLRLHDEIDISDDKNGEITCCFCLSTGDHVFGFIGCLVVYRSDLPFMQDISINNRYPTDITETRSNGIIAVATGYQKEVMIINISMKTILNTIVTKDPLWGITFRDGCLIYCAQDIGLNSTNLSQSPPSTTCIYQMRNNFQSYVKVTNGQFCITDTANSIVKVLGPNMTDIFLSHHQNNLTKPCNIAADEFGYIFIANKESPSSIVVLSPSGQLCQSFVLNDLKYLCGLSYDITTKCLVVASKGRKVSFYKIRQ